MPGPASPGVLVIVASVPFDGPRLSEQHVALALAARHPVLYLDPPQASWTRSGGRTPNVGRMPVGWLVREPSPGLTRATLTVPPGMRGAAVLPWVDRVRSAYARRLIAARGQRAAAILSAAGRPTVFRGFPGARRVFWAKDDYVAGATLIGLSAERIAAGHRDVGRCVDAAVAVTPGLLETWQQRVGEALLIPAGADDAMAAATQTRPPAPEIRLPHPIAGFVGQISDRIDLGLLESVASSGASLLLVGPRQASFSGQERFDALLEAPTVQWVGAQPYDELPAYLAAIDVGLIPYGTSAFNIASFPLKLLEYLSVGAGVVATDLPAVRWLDSPEVTVAGPADWADAVASELAIARAGGSDLDVRRAARRAEARSHSWAVRAEDFERVLHLDRVGAR